MIILGFLMDDNPRLSNIANIVAILTFVIPIITLLIKRWHNSNNKIRNRPSCLTEEEVDKYTKIYIHARLSGDERCFRCYSFINRCIMRTTKQYHLILGDTGTGKSAFLINCYFIFCAKVFKRGYVVNYLTLRDPSTLEEISLIENKKNTILFLDAFDESSQAAIDAKKMLKKLECRTKEFAKIIIASRAHFFDSKEDEPSRTSTARAIDLEETKYQKYNLLPFKDNDVSLYLIKKFGFNIRKLILAKSIVKKSDEIMSRPLILSFIELLLEKERFSYAYEIYEIVVSKLIERELRFMKMVDQSAQEISLNSDAAKSQYRGYLNKISIAMYNNIEKTGEPAVEINHLKLPEPLNNYFQTYSKRNRTLLERKYDNLFIFSHRSVFEYFIAKNIHKISNFRFDLNLKQTYRFLAEMYEAGFPDVQNIIEGAPKYWHMNINSFQSDYARIEYTNNPKDGMIFEFVNYDYRFIFEQVEKIRTLIIEQQKRILKVDNRYVRNKVNYINASLQKGLSQNKVVSSLSELSDICKSKLAIDQSDVPAFSKIQILGQYEDVYTKK